MDLHWVVIANASQARIFRLQHNAQLDAVETLRHEESRNAELLNAQEEGGMASEGGKAKERERPRFAGMVAEYLKGKSTAQQVKTITLVAPAQMLGDLRHACRGSLASHIGKTISKDLVHHDTKEIQNVLFANQS